ncbi:sodium:proton antiporter [Shewanella sp. 10N.286.52.C2]|uniref:cation:proton antiporter n=1 Tax=Shewanella sp. 10N.286.52.C2 TaxID=1880838 RepID=UPI000C842446|nr:cation:proton antiporter [Shewanella sp. 10N.286.52.C2]PMG28324.1 sodium:proton antiporter [Shewanella sp. 10N.286.52.C2]
MYIELAILAVFTLCYSLVAGRFERSMISGPMVFVLVGFVLGPLVLNWLGTDLDGIGLRVFADITLAIVLFCDASNSNLSVLRKHISIPTRMLMYGLPGAILLGVAVGFVLFPNLGIFEIAALATMLAATDAALGKAVVSSPIVPARLREGLNIESGLNDGICVPILFVFLALAAGTVAEGDVSELAVHFLVEELGIGLVVGLTTSFMGASLIKLCHKKGWITDVWSQNIVLSLALSCFAISQELGGSGYIAAFTGGLLFGHLCKETKHKLLLPTEGMGEIMALLTWLLFGAFVIGNAFHEFTWTMLIYALLSLTIVRMLPIFLSLGRAGGNIPSKIFLGWFGPRGLASIVFVIIMLDKDLPGGNFMAMTVICTVFISLILHGMTAQPFAKWISKRAD